MRESAKPDPYVPKPRLAEGGLEALPRKMLYIIRCENSFSYNRGLSFYDKKNSFENASSTLKWLNLMETFDLAKI